MAQQAQEETPMQLPFIRTYDTYVSPGQGLLSFENPVLSVTTDTFQLEGHTVFLAKIGANGAQGNLRNQVASYAVNFLSDHYFNDFRIMNGPFALFGVDKVTLQFMTSVQLAQLSNDLITRMNADIANHKYFFDATIAEGCALQRTYHN